MSSDPNILTPELVAEMVEKIRAGTRDPESAHEDEDVMHVKVLEHIAAGTCKNPRACAAAALESQKIDFPRWCA